MSYITLAPALALEWHKALVSFLPTGRSLFSQKMVACTIQKGDHIHYLGYKSHKYDHAEARDDVSMVLDDKLMAKYRWTISAVWPSQHPATARSLDVLINAQQSA